MQSPADAIHFARSRCEEYHAGKALPFVVVLARGVVGYVALQRCEASEFHELVYAISPAMRGLGIGAGAVRLLLSELTKLEICPRIIAKTEASNAPSNKLLSRLGFRATASSECGLLFWQLPTHRAEPQLTALG